MKSFRLFQVLWFGVWFGVWVSCAFALYFPADDFAFVVAAMLYGAVSGVTLWVVILEFSVKHAVNRALDNWVDGVHKAIDEAFTSTLRSTDLTRS